MIDFGIARIYKPDNSADTEVLGTRGYAPPEQYGLFDLGQTDPRSDIYALGITLKEFLGKDYDGRLKKILDKCTAQAPAQRYQSAAELRAAVINSKKFQRVKKIFIAATTGLVVFFLPQALDVSDIPQPPEEISDAPEVTTPAEEKISAETFEASAIKIPSTSLPEINSPPSAPLPEINLSPSAPLPEINPSTPAQSQEKISGKVELSLYLNGELTGKEHMVYLNGWQSWRRDKYGQILFPDSWRARLHIDNHSGKDLLNPRLEVNIGRGG